MLVEMADMGIKAPLGIVRDILVKIDKFLFPSDFVILDQTPNSTVILGRPFLATVHAQISVSEKEILVGIGDERVEDSVWSKRYSEWCNENSHDKKPRPRDYTFIEWVIDKSTEALGPDENPFGRCLDEYIWLKVRIKIGGMITGEDEEKMELGNEDYNPPIVHTETFEVTKYKFNNGCSFICVSGKSNKTLSLGRKNGSRFRKMLMEEMEETLRDDGEDSVDET
ncbi:reverse transcriptase domain-containing protein [Tanacetum coccineum]